MKYRKQRMNTHTKRSKDNIKILIRKATNAKELFFCTW